MNSSLELIRTHAEALGWALLHSLWQGAVVSAVLFIALGLLSNSAARHAACLLALLAIAIITARSTWQPRAAAALPAVATVSTPTPTTAVSAPLAPVSDFVALPPQTSDASSPVPTAALSQRSWREKLQRCVP